MLSQGRLCMLLIIVSALALPFLASVAFSYKAEARLLQQQLTETRRQADQEGSAKQQLSRWSDASEQWHALAARADQRGWRTSLWDVRSIEVDAKRFSRVEADTLLSSLESGQDGFMLPKAFSLKLLSDNGSLFIASPASDQRSVVQLSLSGEYYSRRAQ